MQRFLLALLASAVAAAPTAQTCSNQVITVNNEWTLPLTNIAKGQMCTYSFNLPQNTFALVDLQAQNLNGASIYVSDDYQNTILIGGKGVTSASKTLALPGNVRINIQTPDTNALLIQIKISAKKATPQANVVGKISTDFNAASSVLYFEQWQEGASYIVNSLKSKVNLKVALSNNVYGDDLEQIFVYEGGAVVGTLKNVLNNFNFISTTNQLTLYMARKLNVKGAVLVSDNSNVEGYFSHDVSYVPISDRSRGSLVEGNKNKAGAITVIGDSDGSTPITISEFYNLDNLNGQLSVGAGGPVADISKTSVVGSVNLPKKLTGNVNTIYISKGEGVVNYFI